jgi:hypothetical protein
MAKKYILKSIGNGVSSSIGNNRPFERNLINLSALGIRWDSSVIKQVRTNVQNNYDDRNFGMSNVINLEDEFTRAHESISGNNKFIAFYDQTYAMRRDFLRKFALQPEIEYVLETIADAVIVNDDMHYFAYPNTKTLKSILKPEHGKKIVDELNEAYKHVCHMFNFNQSNDAWHYCKKFLVDGFLAFEIVYSDTKDGKYAKDIICFKELDPITMQPEIRIGPDGKEYKVWVIDKGNSETERVLLDTNVIYISWAKNNFVSHYSYCETLIKSFNMLRTLENSRLIWNIQNAQKRIKIVVPIGSESDQIAQTRLRQLEAYYKEDINIDNFSGEVTHNGVSITSNPKFSFAKTYMFPSKEGSSTEISEIDVAGHDMNSTDQLKWFWQKFIIETRLPRDRFNMFFDGNDTSAIPDTSNMTREELRFDRMVGRIRDIYEEIVIKPTWIQFCLHNKEFANNDVLKNAIGLTFTEENIFKRAKESANLQVSTGIISNLSSLQGPDGKPFFSMKFLLQRYLDISDDDWVLNEKMKRDEEKHQVDSQIQQGNDMLGGGMSDMSGGLGDNSFGSMGGGMSDMSGGMSDMSGDLGDNNFGSMSGGDEFSEPII